LSFYSEHKPEPKTLSTAILTACICDIRTPELVDILKVSEDKVLIHQNDGMAP
jgi:hypothetical protein